MPYISCTYMAFCGLDRGHKIQNGSLKKLGIERHSTQSQYCHIGITTVLFWMLYLTPLSGAGSHGSGIVSGI